MSVDTNALWMEDWGAGVGEHTVRLIMITCDSLSQATSDCLRAFYPCRSWPLAPIAPQVPTTCWACDQRAEPTH